MVVRVIFVSKFDFVLFGVIGDLVWCKIWFGLFYWFVVVQFDSDSCILGVFCFELINDEFCDCL